MTTVQHDERSEPPPQTVAATQVRRDSKGDLSYGCVDWYYYKNPRPADSALDTH